MHVSKVKGHRPGCFAHKDRKEIWKSDFFFFPPFKDDKSGVKKPENDVLQLLAVFVQWRKKKEK